MDKFHLSWLLLSIACASEDAAIMLQMGKVAPLAVAPLSQVRNCANGTDEVGCQHSSLVQAAAAKKWRGCSQAAAEKKWISTKFYSRCSNWKCNTFVDTGGDCYRKRTQLWYCRGEWAFDYDDWVHQPLNTECIHLEEPVQVQAPPPKIHDCPPLVKGGKVSLKGGRYGKYCADEGTNGITCNRDHVGDWERFLVVHVSGRMFQLKGGNAGRFCEDGIHGVQCNHEMNRGSPLFTVKEASILTDNACTIAFTSSRQVQYCADEGTKIVCNRDHVGLWEKFVVEEA